MVSKSVSIFWGIIIEFNVRNVWKYLYEWAGEKGWREEKVILNANFSEFWKSVFWKFKCLSFQQVLFHSVHWFPLFIITFSQNNQKFLNPVKCVDSRQSLIFFPWPTTQSNATVFDNINQNFELGKQKKFWWFFIFGYYYIEWKSAQRRWNWSVYRARLMAKPYKTRKIETCY